MFEKEKFVERLNSLMKQNKLSKQALADAIGVSRAAASQFAHGANLPSIPTLVTIADYFNVSLDYLVGRSDEPERQ